MANDYFNHTNRALENTLITADQINDGFDAVVAGFDKLPDSASLVAGLNTYASAVYNGTDYDVAIASITSYLDSLTIKISPDTTNVNGSEKLRINSLGYINLKRDDLTPIQPGDLIANSIYTISYGETASAWILQTAPSSIVSEIAEIYDNFDDRYLGAKAAEPSLDNDDNALQSGTLFFDTTEDLMKVYNGADWQPANTYVKYVSDTPPLSPYDGQEWFDTSAGIDYTWHQDVDSGQWLQQSLVASGTASVSINTAYSFTTLTATGSIDTTKNVNFIDATSGDITATLPSAVTNAGVFLHIKRVDSSTNTVTIDTTASQTIDNYTDIQISENQSLMIVSDETNWRIL